MSGHNTHLRQCQNTRHLEIFSICTMTKNKTQSRTSCRLVCEVCEWMQICSNNHHLAGRQIFPVLLHSCKVHRNLGSRLIRAPISSPLSANINFPANRPAMQAREPKRRKRCKKGKISTSAAYVRKILSLCPQSSLA